MEGCPSDVVVVRRFSALIPRSFADACFLFVFSNFINCLALLETPLRSVCVLFDDQQIRLWSGHVCM